MNQPYPDGHHPVYFLQKEMNALGIRADFARDARTLDCWGLIFPDHDNRVLVYLIDNRLPHEIAKEDAAAKELLNRGAIVCHAQKPDAERAGGHWLPLAASPGFEPVNVAKTSDVAFVGYVRDDARARMLADVAAKFKLSVNQGVFGKQANEAYCGALCGLNIVSYYGQPFAYDAFNMRSPEIMACGVPLVTEFQPYMTELGLVQGNNVLGWRSPAQMLECIDFVVHHPDLAAEIGQAGYELVQKYHTYRARAVRVGEWLTM